MQNSINVASIIEKKLAITETDGQKVFAALKDALDSNVQVVLDFSDIELVISAFLNAATGQLYKNYTSDFLNSNLSVVGLSDGDIQLLRLVNDRAKSFYSENGAAYTAIIDKELKNG